MKGVILAGGEGKRLQPLGLGVPKPLVLIKGRPLINYNLGLFAKYGVNDVKMIIRGTDREQYARWRQAYAADFPKVNIELIEEPEPMGTLGYLFHYLRGWIGNEDVFVTNGDDIKDVDLKKMFEFHRRNKTFATLALMKMEKPDGYGAVLVKESKITEFLEKRPGLPPGLVSAGMYLISPGAFSRAAADTFKGEKYLMFEKHLFPVLASAQGLGGFVCGGKFFDCGTPERLEEAIREA